MTSDPIWLADIRERGRAAWPQLEVSTVELAAALRSQIEIRDNATVDELAVDAAEIYLACACERGDTAAVIAFRDAYYAPIEPAIAKMGLDASQRDDLWQALAVRLFVASAGEPARIVSYAGRGQLHGLVKVAATRLALDILERQQRFTANDDWLDRVPGASSDPELHWIKLQHRTELKQEVELAIAALSTKDRALLRLTLVERLGIDAIATTYQTHRSTVARWITRARAELAEGVRARLVERWRISHDELGHIGPMIDSQLDLSLERLLSAS